MFLMCDCGDRQLTGLLPEMRGSGGEQEGGEEEQQSVNSISFHGYQGKRGHRSRQNCDRCICVEYVIAHTKLVGSHCSVLISVYTHTERTRLLFL